MGPDITSGHETERNRERKSGRHEAAREKVLRAAVRLIGREGLPAASLSTTAREAGTSKAALLYHFERRENLLQALATSRR